MQNNTIEFDNLARSILILSQEIEENFDIQNPLQIAEEFSYEYILNANLSNEKKSQLLEMILMFTNDSHYTFEDIGLFRKKKNKIEIPAGIIIGGVEILGGALLCIIPWGPSRAVGAAMMTDGVRRALDSSEDEENKRREEERRYQQDLDQ